MDKICKFHCDFDNHSGDTFFLGQTVNGKAFIVPNQDFHVRHFGFHLIFESRGKVVTSSQIVLTKYISNNAIFKKDREYVFEFDFINHDLANFKGKNTNFFIRLEFFIEIEGKTVNTKSTSIFNRLINTLQNKNTFTDNIYLTFEAKDVSFIVEDSSDRLKYATNAYLVAVMGLCVIIFFVGLAYEHILFCILLGISCISLFIVVYFITNHLINSLDIKYQNLDHNNFACLLSKFRGWKSINEIVVSYEIREEVIDRRGTSDTTLRETLHTSKKQNRNVTNNKETFNFKLPTKMPCTLVIGDSRIKYLLILNVKYPIGINFTFEKEIVVKRKSIA